MDNGTIELIAKQLFEAEETRVPIPPITDKYPDLTLEDAYKIQLASIEMRKASGQRVVGKKVGLTIGGIMPAFEIVERRCFPLSKTIEDSICDNAACGKVVLGNKITTRTDIDFRTIGLLIEKNGVPIDMCCSASVLVNKLATFGSQLYKDEIVITGSIGMMHDVQAGDVFYAHYGDGLGSVKVCFTE